LRPVIALDIDKIVTPRDLPPGVVIELSVNDDRRLRAVADVTAWRPVLKGGRRLGLRQGRERDENGEKAKTQRHGAQCHERLPGGNGSAYPTNQLVTDPCEPPMSDDLNRDEDRIRPGRESPMRPAGPERPPPRRRDYDDEDLPPRRRKSDGGMKTLFIILAIVGVVGFSLIAAVVVGFVLLIRTAVKSVGPAIAKAQATNNFKQVSLGVMNYHDKYGRFPPVAMPTR